MTITARRLRLKNDRAFFGAAATAATLVLLTAVAPVPFALAALDGPPSIASVNMAAAAQTLLTLAWLLLFRVAGRRAAAPLSGLDDPLDRAAIGVASALVLVGGLATVNGAPDSALPLPWLALFAGFAIAAMATRPHADAYKRLMLLATLSLLAPAAARVAALVGRAGPLPDMIDGMLIADLFLIALLLYDLRGRGRLQPVTLWAGGLFLLAQPLQLALHAAPAGLA